MGLDRITKRSYDANGRVTQVQTAFGQAEQANEGTLTKTANGQLASVKDAEINLANYDYDGYDRQFKTRYPALTAGANTSSSTDYEQLTFDAGGNATQRRLRDGSTITLAYDNMGRVTARSAARYRDCSRSSSLRKVHRAGSGCLVWFRS